MAHGFELKGDGGNFHCTLPDGYSPIYVYSADWITVTSVASVCAANGEETLVLVAGVQPLVKVRVSILAKPWPLLLELPPKQELLLNVEPRSRDPWREFVFTWRRGRASNEVQ